MVSGVDTRGLAILKEIKAKADQHLEMKPSEIVKYFWAIYESDYNEDNSVNGAVFEEIIGYIFTIKECTPFYMQAKVAYIPTVNYDFILYDKEEGPISISAKTSLRERWKQADLEAVALKYVHRNALSYLVTLDREAVATRTAKLKECMALNDFILADSEKFDQLIETLKARTLDLAGTVEVITSNKIIDGTLGAARYNLS